MKTSVNLLLLCVASFLAGYGCAGYRGGWESAAYVGDTPPVVAEDAATASRAPTIRVPGLEMEVALDNRLRTRDMHVYAIAVPLMIDPRDVYVNNNKPGKTRLHLHVTPLEAGFVFRPSRATLRIGDLQHAAARGSEFGQWGPDGTRVERGGSWDERVVAGEMVLAEPGRRYLLSIDFDTPVPAPTSHEIAVDLAGVLVSARHPALPLIRFAPVRWKEGYT